MLEDNLYQDPSDEQIRKAREQGKVYVSKDVKIELSPPGYGSRDFGGGYDWETVWYLRDIEEIIREEEMDEKFKKGCLTFLGLGALGSAGFVIYKMFCIIFWIRSISSYCWNCYHYINL